MSLHELSKRCYTQLCSHGCGAWTWATRTLVSASIADYYRAESPNMWVCMRRAAGEERLGVLGARGADRGAGCVLHEIYARHVGRSLGPAAYDPILEGAECWCATGGRLWDSTPRVWPAPLRSTGGRVQSFFELTTTANRAYRRRVAQSATQGGSQGRGVARSWSRTTHRAGEQAGRRWRARGTNGEAHP